MWTDCRTAAILETRSAYQSIFVGERHGVRFLRFGGARASWQGACVIARPERLYFPYQQAFSLYTAWRPQVRRFLSLGVGTATAISHVYRRHPTAEIVGIDIDGMVIDAARRFFHVPDDPRVRLLQADARLYVPRMGDKFDLVFLDAFFREETPQTMLSPVFLSALADRLEPGGILIANVIMPTAGRRSRRFFDLCRHLKLLVGPVWALPLGLVPLLENNVIVVAQRAPSGLPALDAIRGKARREIRAHPAVYAPFGRFLPGRIQRV